MRALQLPLAATKRQLCRSVREAQVDLHAPNRSRCCMGAGAGYVFASRRLTEAESGRRQASTVHTPAAADSVQGNTGVRPEAWPAGGGAGMEPMSARGLVLCK